MNVKRWRFWGLALGMGMLTVAASRHPAAETTREAASRPELAYLEQVNRWRPPSDPQLVLLLMAQFANANRHAEGAAFFEERRRQFDARLDDEQRALYLAAAASLRAGHAHEVPLLERYGWVRRTVQMLDD